VSPADIQSLIEEATFDYTMGEADAALAKLARATAAAPAAFEAWHACAEINFSLRRFDAALAAAETALALRPDDLFINTTLSRIYGKRGQGHG
jgi:predicted Zn-dependent protease